MLFLVYSGGLRAPRLLEQDDDPEAGFVENVHRQRHERHRERIAVGSRDRAEDEKSEEEIPAVSLQECRVDDADARQRDHDDRRLKDEREREEDQENEI